MKNAQLYWLRNDLRCHDNLALWNASQSGPVVAVCLISPATWQAHDDSPIKVDFWMRNLRALKHSLSQRNIPLRIATIAEWSEAPSALLTLARQLGVETIWFNDEYGIHEQQRDDAVDRAFSDAGLGCQRFTDQILFKPGSVLTQAGTMFKVYSQFRKVAYQRLHTWLPECVPAPPKQTVQNLESDSVPAAVEGFAVPGTDQQSLWPAGEQAAADRLAHFSENILLDYERSRDRPDQDGTSRLSPYLVSGVLSPRQCLHAAIAANRGEFDAGNAGATTWINELLWREFYKHILVCYPHVSRHRAFRENMEKLPWRNDPKALEAWKQGQTGIPIIDAAMRQLLATGWMHNRLRMLTAMFLSKNLLIDWREGERWFMRQLIDGDLAANNGGWQWSSSTGTDSAPYFRIFNPVTQSRKFDPDGLFIRQWVPELEHLSNKQIHQPPIDDLFSATSYPAAIVDLGDSRRRALDAFKGL
ncbi:MAG TPA: deoxyribodipyrimidine photo-lyase [Pseudomonas xinjiangensis]|uniref:Deoxyribodipyrimidine photo-lyase n=2 Tax=root TaxID=1 RepID=A0A7V1BN96_9GAMM|nr:deoxyribodipyrimidine photo-lyase [Halopseudomonas xinjiangensis]HEC49238.1 deoxyribodipyrimidine photo-lyase [Halopseudomonas xinjiangensis]